MKDDNNLASELQSQPWGSPRYLAPEFLVESSGSQCDMDGLRRGDMYSYGLVLWELARRCGIHGKLGEGKRVGGREGNERHGYNNTHTHQHA